MKLLLDTCVWGKACKELQSAGHEVVWAGEWPEDPGDDEILERAHREGRVPVTLDKDFGELAIIHGIPHSEIIRLVRADVGRWIVRLIENFERIAKALKISFPKIKFIAKEATI